MSETNQNVKNVEAPEANIKPLNYREQFSNTSRPTENAKMHGYVGSSFTLAFLISDTQIQQRKDDRRAGRPTS
ncbi:hypothetical protein CVT24_006767 [Panaeolus cyanescens]|uniref:Uncharacterized protein n=1 Tax=Panaeolus cyanescens TaxID=181874 RepID=A0A409V9F4_9AGAR|nr:hypothetical protein CVT24_006767 [Panaeolus cyanescens]